MEGRGVLHILWSSFTTNKEEERQKLFGDDVWGRLVGHASKNAKERYIKVDSRRIVYTTHLRFQDVKSQQLTTRRMMRKHQTYQRIYKASSSSFTFIEQVEAVAAFNARYNPRCIRTIYIQQHTGQPSSADNKYKLQPFTPVPVP